MWRGGQHLGSLFITRLNWQMKIAWLVALKMDPWGGTIFELGRDHFRPLFLFVFNTNRGRKWTLPSSKMAPPHRSIFRATSQAISSAKSNERWRRMRVWCRLRPHVQKTIVDRFPMPFSGSVSPNGAIFPYWLLSNAHPSFGAILRKKGTVEVPLCVRIFVHGKWH